jgi:hypothetical protein
MGYYSDAYMLGKPDYKKVGTYFGEQNAIDIADRLSKSGDVMITHTEHKFNADFYSVWLKKKTLIERLLEIRLWD